jgi:hypothetical protein
LLQLKSEGRLYNGQKETSAADDISSRVTLEEVNTTQRALGINMAIAGRARAEQAAGRARSGPQATAPEEGPVMLTRSRGAANVEPGAGASADDETGSRKILAAFGA